jgi:hypothetical protein
MRLRAEGTLPPQIVNPVRLVSEALLHLGATLAPSASACAGSITRACADTSTTSGSLAGSVPARSDWARASSRNSKEAGVGAEITYKLSSVIVR